MAIYLDHNATTPLRPEAREAMLRVLRDVHGNPSSSHAEGARARAELERARERVAAALRVTPAEVVFTSGATEANNLALQGLARARLRGGAAPHVVTTAIEHPSVLGPLGALEQEGWEVTRVGVDAEGRVDPEAFAAALRDDTALVTVIWANNETGTVQPVERIAECVKARGIPLHLDATQAIGKLPVDLRRLPADLVSASAHKFNGPKGVGLLVVREGVALEPWIRGGSQEHGRRAGTENTAGIVGLAVACELAAREVAERAAREAELRDRLWEGIRSKVPRVRRNGSEEHVLPNTLNVEFEGVPGEVLLEALDLEGICVSAGAACHSGSHTSSHVLLAMGRSPEAARSSIRFSVGWGVTADQIEAVVTLLPALVERARENLAS